MPIDLDSLIYVVPCGEPGDVDALSGRAHICPDRMRIAVTECASYCPHCEDGGAYQYDVVLHDLRICPGWEVLQGTVNETPHRAFLVTAGEPYCLWRSPILFQLRDNNLDPPAVHDINVDMYVWDRPGEDTITLQVVFRDVPGNGRVFLWLGYAHRLCREFPVLPNWMVDCATGLPGSPGFVDGTAELLPV